MLQNNGEPLSAILFALVMLICFLSCKKRWRESTFHFAMAAVCALGALSKLLVLLGPEPKVPLFLALYSLTALLCLGLGLIDRKKEKALGVRRE